VLVLRLNGTENRAVAGQLAHTAGLVVEYRVVRRIAGPVVEYRAFGIVDGMIQRVDGTSKEANLPKQLRRLVAREIVGKIHGPVVDGYLTIGPLVENLVDGGLMVGSLVDGGVDGLAIRIGGQATMGRLGQIGGQATIGLDQIGGRVTVGLDQIGGQVTIGLERIGGQATT
jgi:hypothetical protein